MSVSINPFLVGQKWKMIVVSYARFLVTSHLEKPVKGADIVFLVQWPQGSLKGFSETVSQNDLILCCGNIFRVRATKFVQRIGK